MFWWQTESVRNINKTEIHLDIFKTSKTPWQEKLEIGNESIKGKNTINLADFPAVFF